MPKGQPGTKAPHGTITRYTKHDCRCDDCKRAIRDYNRRKYGHRPREVVDAERAAQHGTESKYRNGCRCDLCKSAANADRARRRLSPNPARHGVYSSYGNGCRCDACREAHARYGRALKARRTVAA